MNHAPRETSHSDRPPVEMETSLRFVWPSVAILIALVGIGMFLMWTLLNAFSALPATTKLPDAKETGVVTPQEEPDLNPNQSEQLARLRAKNDAVLGSYDWIDREANVARIPIERAMELSLERGFPVRGEQSKEATE